MSDGVLFTRDECEKKIIHELKKIERIYKLYNPEGKYLTMTFIDDGDKKFFSVSNSYTNEDANSPLDCHRFIEGKK